MNKANPETPELLYQGEWLRMVKRGQWDEEQWKALTGGDPLMAKLLYKDLVPFTNRAVHIISSNDKAFITDVSDAVYRRLCFVEWVQTAGIFERIDNR